LPAISCHSGAAQRNPEFNFPARTPLDSRVRGNARDRGIQIPVLFWRIKQKTMNPRRISTRPPELTDPATGAKSALATVAIPNVTTPPGFVTVRSSAGGWDRQQVMYLGAAAGTALFQPDSASTAMNLPAIIDVLANDIGVAPAPTLQICTTATGGTCGTPSATATCTVGTTTTSCTAQGGKLAIANNRVTY
jgi:hypothetical protein